MKSNLGQISLLAIPDTADQNFLDISLESADSVAPEERAAHDADTLPMDQVPSKTMPKCASAASQTSLADVNIFSQIWLDTKRYFYFHLCCLSVLEALDSSKCPDKSK